jgi:hypothetical protein
MAAATIEPMTMAVSEESGSFYTAADSVAESRSPLEPS